ncbi:polyprenyl synthetase family protein [Candidatus Daviesbacteria bacterium]|nr:polyprenyl synthetase family protein [Candidatus Daviesbacteria bacterium]
MPNYTDLIKASQSLLKIAVCAKFSFISYMADISDLLKSYQNLVENSLEKIFPRRFNKQQLVNLIGKLRYQIDEEAIYLTINKPVWDLLDRGGKRWRPILFLTILDLLGKDPKSFLDISVIFEVIHNGTLMIDDIEDLSRSRRGKPAVHLLFGQDVAINAGNMMYFLPLLVLKNYRRKLSKDIMLRLFETYNQEMSALHLGQATDIGWHAGLVNDFNITKEQYLQMCAFKTGGLARMAAKMAAISAEASDETIEAFGQLGESLGVVFQIQDDLLNITENQLSSMKGLGDDITEGKRSLPVIIALSSLAKSKSRRLIKILLMHTNKPELILEAIELIKQGMGIEKSQEIMVKLFNTAWSKLEPLLKNTDKKDQLYNLARFLVDRKV